MYSHKSFTTGTVPDCQIAKIRNEKSQRVSNANAGLDDMYKFFFDSAQVSFGKFATNQVKIMQIHLSLSFETGKGTAFTHIRITEMENKIRKCG